MTAFFQWFSFALAFLIPALVYGSGREVGNGGNDVAAHFSEMGLRICKVLSEDIQDTKLKEDKLLSSEDVKDFCRAIEQSKVFVTLDRLFLEDRGIEVVAKNFSSKMEIIISRNSWLELDLDTRVTIVIHEYLGLTRKEENNYSVSSGIFEKYIRGRSRILFGPELGASPWYWGAGYAFPIGRNVRVRPELIYDRSLSSFNKNIDYKIHALRIGASVLF